MKMCRFVFVAFVHQTVIAQSSASNPVGKAVELLGDLKKKISKDASAEAAAFKEYTEWCKDFTTNTKFDITTAESQREKLEAAIASQSAAIAEASSAIERLGGEVSSTKNDLDEATALRKKEAAEFASGERELVEVIDALGRAISILDRQMQKDPSLVQTNLGHWSSLLETLGAIADAAAFSSSDKEQLTAFVQSKALTSDDDDELGAPAAASYKTHSGSIFDVLEDLKEKAEVQLRQLRRSEANNKHNYEMLRQSLKDQVSADSKEMDSEKTRKAETKEKRATAESDLARTKEELETSRKALATTTSSCEQVAATHDATVTSREEELKTIAEAIDVLKSSTGGAVGQTYSFLDVATASKSKSRTEVDVLRLIKRLARQQHSAALAQLASRVANAVKYASRSNADPFRKVKGLIEDMLSRLQAEAGAEATEKAFCDEEMKKTADKNGELGAEKRKLSSKIDVATARTSELSDDVRELQNELARIAKEQAEMNVLREKTHKDYIEAKADLEQGLVGVRKAIVILRHYYSQSDEAEFIQQPAKPEKYSKAAGAATSIVGLLEVVDSDFAKNLAEEEANEAEAQESYEKISQENKISKATKESDVKYKSQEITSLAKALAELKSDRDTTNTELNAVAEYDAKLKERCIAKPETYEDRKRRREAELAGLKEALSILEGEASFLQRRKHRAMRKNLIS